MFEKETRSLVGRLLLRNESCYTVQNVRDRIFKKHLEEHARMLNKVNLDTIELLTSFCYSSLPFVWNTLIVQEKQFRSIDELWIHVWANHLENSGNEVRHDGDFPERLNSEQERVVRKIVNDWEQALTTSFSLNRNLSLFSLATIPEKDFLIIGGGNYLLEDFQHPLTRYLSKSDRMLLSKTKGYQNRETNAELILYNFLGPASLKIFLESYTALRHGTAYLSCKIDKQGALNLFRNKSLIQSELALSAKTISFEGFQGLHKSISNYKI